MGDCMGNFQDLSFLLKFIAMILNICNLLLWCLSDYHDNAMEKRWQICLFAHTVPAYIVVLIGMVILYCLGEQPGQWFQRLFLVTGALLFIITGILALINCLSDGDKHSSWALIIAILCVVIGVLLLVDILKNENVF